MVGALRALLTGAMRDLGMADQAVFLRAVAATGEDALLGIKGDETVTDTEVAPRPWVANVSEKKVAESNGRLLFGDLQVLFPPGVAESAVRGADAVVVGADEYRVVRVDTFAFQGQAVQVAAVVRRVVRP